MEELLPSITCLNCTELIRGVYVSCAQCEAEPPLTLCLACFACGAALASHDRTHNYRLATSGGACLFGPATNPPPSSLEAETAGPSGTGNGAGTSATASGETTDGVGSDWGIPWCHAEEVLLLDAAERYNLGNWEAVAEAVNPRRSPAECKEHYDKFYLRGRLGAVTTRGYQRPPLRAKVEPPLEALNSPPLRASVTKLNSDDLALLAYMPRRDDFEKEWHNEAEKTIADLQVDPVADDALDKAVKMAMVDNYLCEVARRRRLKGLARDYDLVPAFLRQERPSQALKAWKYSPQQMKEMKAERELRDSLKNASQFLPFADSEALVTGLTRERQLKERILELQSYRKKGITSLEGRRAKFDSESPQRKRRNRKRSGWNSTGASAVKKWARLRRWQKKLAGAA